MTVWVVFGFESTQTATCGAGFPHGVWCGQSVMSDNNSRLFVGNLSFQTQERDLQDFFSAVGVVTNVNLMLDKFTGKSRGFAFVEFSTVFNAATACTVSTEGGGCDEQQTVCRLVTN